MSDPFPSMEIFSPDDEETLANLVEYLEEFQRRREALLRDIDMIKRHFYYKFSEVSDEMKRIADERDEFKRRFEAKEREQSRIDSKIRALEMVINTNGCGERTPISQHIAPPTYAASASSSSSTHHHHHHHHLPPPPPPSSTNPNRVNRIIGGPSSGGRTNNNAQTPAPHTGRPIGSITNSAAFNRFQTPLRNATNTNAAAGSSRDKEGMPVANRRQQRRSKSAEMWLDHKPPATPKTDTVLQPKVGRKKSVSKLELKDAKHASKYLLTHLQQDENGDIQTNLIKGDILQSPSGGANVIFTEIETLKVTPHEPARPLKRVNDEDCIQDSSIIEDRCAVAIEGHGSSKPKIIKS